MEGITGEKEVLGGKGSTGCKESNQNNKWKENICPLVSANIPAHILVRVMANT